LHPNSEGTPRLGREELRQRVAGVRWWHRIDLGDGVVTPGLDDSPTKLAMLQMPRDLTGKSVLDVGAWDGFFSFEAERRGARQVVATDSFCWNGPGWGNKDGFELARLALGSRVTDREIEVLDISPATVGTFDVVLFLGVLYHMRHPLLALERVAAVTNELLILETHVEVFEHDERVMLFYPRTELNGDPTNWWGPTPSALEAMLHDVGFGKVEIVGRDLTPVHAPKRRLGRAPKRLAGRMAFHAWR
jgi:tRNA (mo5U34)-methyltransferase